MKLIKYTEKFLTIFSIFTAISIIAISFSRPLIPWDSWAYHFAFSAKLFNINDYFHSFALDNTLEERYNGFPLAAEFLQGLLWVITDSLSSMTLINSIPLFLFIWSAEKYGRSNFAILVFGILSFPQIAIHASSTYIDLFMGTTSGGNDILFNLVEGATKTQTTAAVRTYSATQIYTNTAATTDIYFSVTAYFTGTLTANVNTILSCKAVRLA